MKIKVEFVRKLYGSEEGDFSVFSARPLNNFNKISVDKRWGTFTISGDYFIQDNELGEVFTVEIEEDIKSNYPNSYRLIKLHYETPESAIEQWVKLGELIGYDEYEKLINEYSENTKIIDKILDNPYSLSDEKPNVISKGLSKEIYNVVSKDQAKAILFNEFGDIYGVGPGVINSIIEGLRGSPDEMISQIKENPFVLMGLPRIGFGVADKFREHFKIPITNKDRCLYGTSYFLNESFQNSGDTYASLRGAIRYSSQKLGVFEETLLEHLKTLKEEKAQKYYGLRIFGNKITTYNLFKAEKDIYKMVSLMKNRDTKITSEEKWQETKAKALEGQEIKLTDAQNEFLDKINEEPIMLLVGPGGVGKSWLTKIAVDMLMQLSVSYGLFAPTARAAYVMSEYTECEAATIHRGLLPYLDEDAGYMPYDIVIIDEASMIDSELMSKVFETFTVNTRLILIGDDFQLPSVGPGNILYNFINNLKIPTIRLTEVFRQSEESYILKYATDIRNKEFRLEPYRDKVEHKDITFINSSDTDEMNKIALDLYKEAFDKTGDVNEVMLLSPVNRGSAGRVTFNKEIQEMVNSYEDGTEVVFGQNQKDESLKTYFKKDDFIAIKKNNYDVETLDGEYVSVINGDLGTVLTTDKAHLTAEIGDYLINFTKEDVQEYIEHAWSITIHKSQGGQADEVIIVIPPNLYNFISANMLYTAITRAKTKATVVAPFDDLNKSASRFVNFSRKTMLGLYKL